MSIAVVGAGTIGSRHAAHLREAGHRVLTVDPQRPADLADLGKMSRPCASALDAWVVSSPTETHLDVTGRILDLRPDARILLEKPAVCPSEIGDLTAALRRHPAAVVTVNNVYGHSDAVAAFARAVRRIAADDVIGGVTVEFTKNRTADVHAGRFVDRHYGEVGYEWFHMLAVLRSVLPVRAYDAFLAAAPARITPEVRVHSTGRDFPDVELYASMRGAVGHPALAVDAFACPAARQRIAEASIPYGCSLRYRVAQVRFVSGARADLVFEPGHGVADDYKNVHVVRVRDRTGAHRVAEVRGNQLKSAVLAQLGLLTGSSGHHRTQIYRREHAYMAALARHLALPRPPRPPDARAAAPYRPRLHDPQETR